MPLSMARYHRKLTFVSLGGFLSFMFLLVRLGQIQRQEELSEHRKRQLHGMMRGRSHGPSEPMANTSQVPTFYLPNKGYSIPGCPCIRFGHEVESLLKLRATVVDQPWRAPPWFMQKYNFQGESTCSDFTTQRGQGQKVVSYSYYTPIENQNTDSEDSKKFVQQLYIRGKEVREKYPGWLMRVYHNVTINDNESTRRICRLYCNLPHVDLCDVKDLPQIGDLFKAQPIGRMWRFSVLGDPTVELFLSRDIDSVILDREVSAVQQWMSSGREFHVMRDHPNHMAVMLAGLWGGHNKRRPELVKIRDSMFAEPLNLTKKFDQFQLATKLWPIIKNVTLQHDSYTCLVAGHEGSIPFPVRRYDGVYTGWGPFKFKERQKVFHTICPEECRPKEQPKWKYC